MLHYSKKGGAQMNNFAWCLSGLRTAFPGV
jgi:hypothetical protein